MLTLIFSVSAFAQEAEKEKEKEEAVVVLCKMPGNSQGQWIKLEPPTPKVVADFQDKLVYLKILNVNDIMERGVLDRATSDAILKLEKSKGVTYDSTELVGFSQGMKNRLIVAYYTAKRAAEKKQ
jgi:hypothetical protein